MATRPNRPARSRLRTCAAWARNLHLVFVTKYRRGVLDKDAHERLRTAFSKVAADFGAKLVECDCEDDHVHLQVEYPARGSLGSTSGGLFKSTIGNTHFPFSQIF